MVGAYPGAFFISFPRGGQSERIAANDPLQQIGVILS